MIYQSPKEEKKLITDKIYQYINEIKSINKAPDEYKTVTCSEAFQKKNNSLMWRKPKKQSEKPDEFNSPGPGSYNAIDSLITQRHRAATFGRQKREIRILNNDNKILISTKNDEVTPEVGTYFKKTFFKWKFDPYPSIYVNIYLRFIILLRKE